MRHDPDKPRQPVFTQHGVLLVDKPKTWTSFDVVNFIRARFNIPKVGHCGTLDPAATGLLIIAGALAGFFPAMKAAAVNPVEALRDE